MQVVDYAAPPASPPLLSQAHQFLPLKVIESLVITVSAIVVALLLFGLFVAVSGYSPITTYANMWTGSFGKWFNIQSSLTRAAPLLLTGLCTALPLQLGLVVIGGEGALVMGALAAAIVGHAMGGASPLVAVTCMILVAGLVGGAWIALSGALRQFRGVNETISSLLLNYIAINIVLHLVFGPLNDPSKPNDPGTMPIGANVKPFLTGFMGWNVHWGFPLGVLACVAFYVLMNHTVVGFATSVVGGNPRAGKVAGLSATKLTLLICFLGGACAGAAGMIEMAIGSGRANKQMAADLGYEGILVAFLARGNPLAIIPVAIFLGGIKASGGLLETRLDMPASATTVLQGIIFLCVLAAETFYGRIRALQRKEL